MENKITSNVDGKIYDKNIESHINVNKIFGTKFYSKFSKSDGIGPRDVAIREGDKIGNKICIAYQTEFGYSYCTYPNSAYFANQLQIADESERQFHEVICGPCHTYADIDYKYKSISEDDIKLKIFELLECVFSTMEIEFSNLKLIWSSSHDINENKGSLHLVVKSNTHCWKDNQDQQKMWNLLYQFLNENKNKYTQFFNLTDSGTKIIETPIIDSSMYNKNKQFRTIFSHKIGSDRVLKPSKSATVFSPIEITDYFVVIDNPMVYKFFSTNKLISEKPKTTKTYDKSDFEFIIKEKLPGCEIRKISGNLINLNSAGNMVCPIANKTHKSNNSYCFIGTNGICYKCQDPDCMDKTICIYTFEDLENTKLKKIKNEEFEDIKLKNETRMNILRASIKTSSHLFKLQKKYNPITRKQLILIIKDLIVFIYNGSNYYYLTKNIVNNQFEYSIVKNPNNFKISHCWLLDENYENPKWVTLYKIIMEVNDEILYDRIEFQPYVYREDFLNNNPENIFNLFTGFIYSPKPDLEIDESEIYCLLDHIKHIWCQDKMDCYKYILNWIAHLVQKPDKKIGVEIVLKSTMQGAGKNIMWQVIGDHILGSKYYLELNDINQLTGKFNSLLENKILTICDELGIFGGSHKDNDKIKNIISQPKQRIERKGLEAIFINDYNNYVALTNNDWSVKVEAGDRRYFTLEISNEKAVDKKYFKPLVKIINGENPRACEHFYNFLMRIDISDWDIGDIPMTEFKRELKLNSVPKPILYIIEAMKGELLNFKIIKGKETEIHIGPMFLNFNNWASEYGYISNINSSGFKKSLKKIGIAPAKKDGGRIRIGGSRKVGVTIDFDETYDCIRKYLKDPEFTIFTCDDEDEIKDDFQNSDQINTGFPKF